MTGTLTPPRIRTGTRRKAGNPRPASTGGFPAAAARRVVFGVLIGALTMLGVATLNRVVGTQVPVLSTLATLPTGPTGLDAAAAPPATPGSCLSWSRPDAADTAVVDCAQPHLFEQAGAVSLTDQATLPDDRQWRQLVTDRCNPLVIGYLNGRYDPAGRFRIGALKPSAATWADGDRELRCGLQSASRSGAMLPTIGTVAGSDQSAVQEPGTCLGIDGRTVGDPVACVGPHAVETVGIVDLSAKFPGAFPAVEAQDAFLQPECSRIANTYAGGPEVINKKKLTVYWDNLAQESWTAGSRKINCNLAALLPDRSGFAPVTGPVTGEVRVGDTAAPAAATTAPADSPVPAAPPAEDRAPADGRDDTADQPDDAADRDARSPAADQEEPRASSRVAVPLPGIGDLEPALRVDGN